MTAPKETRSIQTWPGGQGFEYYGDPHGPADQRGLRVRTFNGEPAKVWRDGTADEWRTIRIANMAENYAERDILCCDSALVDDLIKGAYEMPRGNDLGEGFSQEEIRNLYADPSDWDLEKCRAYCQDNSIDEPDPNPWEIDRAAIVEALTDASIDCTDDETIETLREALIVNIDDETISGLDDWREACREYAQDNPQEPYEWWRVTSWLCEQLHRIGEVTISNGYGHWWGRTCTGQGLIMDGTLQEIAASFD